MGNSDVEVIFLDMQGRQLEMADVRQTCFTVSVDINMYLQKQAFYPLHFCQQNMASYSYFSGPRQFEIWFFSKTKMGLINHVEKRENQTQVFNFFHIAALGFEFRIAKKKNLHTVTINNIKCIL